MTTQYVNDMLIINKVKNIRFVLFMHCLLPFTIFFKMFVGVQFASDKSIAVVNKEWLTPRKREVWWPTFKFQADFDKAAKAGEKPAEGWSRHEVAQCYFECDDYSKAKNKINTLQYTSDIQSSEEEPIARESQLKKPIRKTVKPLRFESDEEKECLNKSNSLIKRPKLEGVKEKISQSILPATSSPKVLSPAQSASSNELSPSTSTALKEFNSFNISGLDSSFRSNGDERVNKEFHESLLRVMLQIKEQNGTILNLLERLTKEKTVPSLKHYLPENLPITFPIKAFTDVDEIETFLNDKESFNALVLYFYTIGGRDSTQKTNSILKFILSDDIAKEYSFYGKRNNKRPFSNLNLIKAVVQGAETNSPDCTEKEVENIIKVWLKHAPQRIIRSNKHVC